MIILILAALVIALAIGLWREFSKIDEEQIQRHARALGGALRLVRGTRVVREWRNGCEVGP